MNKASVSEVLLIARRRGTVKSVEIIDRAGIWSSTLAQRIMIKMLSKSGAVVAYFDTNIFDNLLKKAGGLTAEDETRLRHFISIGRLRITPSILNIEETLAALHSRRPEIVLPQLRLFSELTDWSRFTKPTNILLEGDIRHFAWNGEASNPFLDDPSVARIYSATQKILDGRQERAELDELLHVDRRQKETFLLHIREADDDTREEVERYRERGEIPDFDQYLREGTLSHAMAFADWLGLGDKCKRRGIGEFIKLRSLAAMVGLSLSFIYRSAVERKKPKIGASRDLQHVPPAAACADFFVTHDDELAFLLRRVPIKGFTAITLRELLDRIATANPQQS